MEILLLIIAVILTLCLTPSSGKALDQCRTEARAQFRAYKTTSSDARFVFNGVDAKIVKEDENFTNTDGTIESYSLTCFARNSMGEYFMFVSNQDSPPFFKHVAHSNAKIVLGKAYVSP